MEFFNLFFQMEINQQILVGGLAGFVLFVLALRIVLITSYHVAMGLANMGAKNLKSKTDIEKLPNGAFGRAAKEYALMAGAGAKVDNLKLAGLSLNTNKLLFFNFNSLGRLLKSLDIAFVPLSILVLVAATSHRLEIALFFAAAFVVMRVIGVVFDVETAKDRYITILSQVLAKNIGKFFPQDTTGAVYTLGADLKEFLARQSAMYSDILIKINGEFTNAIKSNVSTMTESVEATLNAITRHEGVGEAANQIKTLGVVAEAMAERIEHNIKSSQVLEENLQAVRENQRVLGVSVATYEATLKDMTAQIGDAMGKIAAYHMSVANSQIADSIGESLAMAKSANAEQLAEVKEIFNQLTEQNRQQTRILTTLLKGGDSDE